MIGQVPNLNQVWFAWVFSKQPWETSDMPTLQVGESKLRKIKLTYPWLQNMDTRPTPST